MLYIMFMFTYVDITQFPFVLKIMLVYIAFVITELMAVITCCLYIDEIHITFVSEILSVT